MLELYLALKPKRSRFPVEFNQRDAITERIVEPSKAGWFGFDQQSRVKESLIVAIPWPEHHSMLAKCYGTAIPVCCRMEHRKNGHDGTRSKALTD